LLQIHLANLLGNDFGARDQAVAGLKAMGPKEGADKLVLALFNHPNVSARNAARDILRSWSVKGEDVITQCVADVGSADPQRRREALQWLSQAEPVVAQAKAVVFAAGPFVNSPDFQTKRNAQLTVTRWQVLMAKENPVENPTPMNTPDLDKHIQTLLNTKADADTRAKALDELAKSKDDKAVLAIGQWMVQTKDLKERRLGGDALIKIGGKTADKMVSDALLIRTNRPLVPEICRILEAIGTRDCLPYLTQAAAMYGPGTQGFNQLTFDKIKSAYTKVQASGR